MHRKRRGKTTGLQVMRAHVSSLIFAVCCQVYCIYCMSTVNNEEKCAGVVSICDNASMGLKAGCQYPPRMVSLTPDELCQLQ